MIDLPTKPTVAEALARMRPESQLRRLIQRDGLACHWCKRLCDPTLRDSADLYPTREHVVRRADGGSSRMTNLVLACRQCNNCRHSPGWVPGHKPGGKRSVVSVTVNEVWQRVQGQHWDGSRCLQGAIK